MEKFIHIKYKLVKIGLTGNCAPKKRLEMVQNSPKIGPRVISGAPVLVQNYIFVSSYFCFLKSVSRVFSSKTIFQIFINMGNQVDPPSRLNQ